MSIGFLFFIINAYNKRDELSALKTNIVKIQNISKLINDLQQERGLSSGYIGSHGKKFKQLLCAKRHDVDLSFTKFLQTCPTYQKQYTDIKDNLLSLRKKMNGQKLFTEQSFDYYTELIQQLQASYLQTATHIDDLYLNNRLQSYTNLSFMKEALGQIRGAFNGIFVQDKLDIKLIHRAIHAKGMFDLSLHRFEAIISPKFYPNLRRIVSSENYRYIDNTIAKYTTQHVSEFIQNPDIWFSKSTTVIDALYKLEQEYLFDIGKYIDKKVNNTTLELVADILLFIFITLFTTLLGFKLRNDIIRNISLLQQYKNAVDRSSIVSKTDIKGRITYVNDKFCKISGYSKEELLGKPHNIVRHPDMSKTDFKEMWKTILSKKPWFGVVKNKKKDGDYYIVEVTINPILDQNGEIEEFIAIRNDITDIVKLHEDLEHTQEDLIYRMGEIGETRSKETGFHVKRVAKYSELLARYYGLSTQEVTYLTNASPMHDIGKVGIPDEILNKPGKLTKEEWKIMKSHANIGYELFRDSDKPLLKTAAIIAHEHHEKYDGSGYPRGLQGEDIHIYGRITAVADVFDALGSDRCYKKAWDDEKIFKLLKDGRGKQFDPQLIDIFFEHLDEFLKIRDYYTDISSFMKEK
jgi:PAS domain S-box-containing protein